MYVVKCVRWSSSGFWAAMIKLTPRAKWVRLIPWIVLEMTWHEIQVVQPQAQPEEFHRFLTSCSVVTCFPTAVSSRNLDTIWKLLKKWSNKPFTSCLKTYCLRTMRIFSTNSNNSKKLLRNQSDFKTTKIIVLFSRAILALFPFAITSQAGVFHPWMFRNRKSYFYMYNYFYETL